MGGSLAKALKSNIKVSITGIDIDKITLDQALSDEVIDEGKTEIDSVEWGNFDLIIFCTPIKQTIQFMKFIDGKINNSCIVTDIASTKEQVMESAKEIDYHFIGGHPMVGSEKNGYNHSKAHLFENAYFILTPPKGIPSDKLNNLKEILSSIGSIPISLSPEKHDLFTAVISHVPHVVASALVNLANAFDQEDQILLKLAAGGFKDITRIASSNPNLWKYITLTNRERIDQVLQHFLDDLTYYKQQLSNNNEEYIFNYFSEARDTRDVLVDSVNTVIPNKYNLIVDIVDKPGMIAKISTILYEDGINIKNIGIINNREFENGCLEIILENKQDLTLAYEILKQKNYLIFI